MAYLYLSCAQALYNLESPSVKEGHHRTEFPEEKDMKDIILRGKGCKSKKKASFSKEFAQCPPAFAAKCPNEYRWWAHLPFLHVLVGKFFNEVVINRLQSNSFSFLQIAVVCLGGGTESKKMEEQRKTKSKKTTHWDIPSNPMCTNALRKPY